MKLVRLLIIILFLFIANFNFVFGQNKKKFRNFFKFKNKKIEQPLVLETKNSENQSLAKIDTIHLDSLVVSKKINPQKELSLVHEDTSFAFPHYFNIPIQVSEQLKIDSVWLVLKKYYSIWDSKKINPYKIDGEKFTDSINIPIFYKNIYLKWSMPISQGHITSPFGLRKWRWHYGSDLRLAIGDSVKATFDGIVRISHYDRSGYGNYVLIRHYNGLETLYGHFKKRLVNVGDVVKAGDVIGLGGNTGRSTNPHVHFEIRYEGNAINPVELFDFVNDSLVSDTLAINKQTFAYLKKARKIRYHKIKRGDTLGHISMKYGIPINKICRLNKISRKTILRINRKLRLT